MDHTPHYPQRDGLIINSTEQLPSDHHHHLHQTKKPIRPPQKEPSLRLNCPRCTSTDTKFCYYNNYSLSQPRYFCKTCKRYWTEGGTLRNVPVGGGSRRNKRPSSSSSSSSKKIIIDSHPDHAVPHHLLNHHQWQDLTLNPNPNPNPPIISLPPIPMPIRPVSAGFTIPTSQDQILKQGLNFSLNYGYPNGFGSLQLGFQENSINNEGARVFFPHVPNDDQFQQGTGQGDQGTTSGYWAGMLGGGGSW